MPKKIVVPDPGEPGPNSEIQVSPPEHMEYMRCDYEAKMAVLQTKLAEAVGRAVRLEIDVAARAANEGVKRAQDDLHAALVRQKDFAEKLARSYHFAWTTHSFDPDMGIVRRVAED